MPLEQKDLDEQRDQILFDLTSAAERNVRAVRQGYVSIHEIESIIKNRFDTLEERLHAKSQTIDATMAVDLFLKVPIDQNLDTLSVKFKDYADITVTDFRGEPVEGAFVCGSGGSHTVPHHYER